MMIDNYDNQKLQVWIFIIKDIEQYFKYFTKKYLSNNPIFINIFYKTA